MSGSLLEIERVSKSFAGVVALRDVSLSVTGGEIHCIAGQNGSGKSTLIKVISGVHQPDAGTISIDGKSVTSATPREAIAAGVQVIYQDFSLFDNLSVAENLALAPLLHEGRLWVHRRDTLAIAQRALAPLAVELPLDEPVVTLPVAGKQLVAIARALMSGPRLLIMDEPTAALTGREVAALFRVVRDIRDRGVAVIFVSHKMREMFEISDRVTVLRNGQVVASGAMAAFDQTKITRAMTGADLQGAPYVHASSGSASPRLETRGLSTVGLFDATLQIMPGEIVGVAGLLGAGRTELALALFGMRPDYDGEILIDGKPVQLRSIQAAVDHGVSYVPEDRLSEGLFLSQTIANNAISAAVGTSKSLGMDWAAIRRRGADMLISLGVTAAGEQIIQELSGGNQQRVVLGRWLLTSPKILLLNGPTAGVDVGAKSELHKLIRRLAAEKGLAVMMISDELSELLENCNRILIMHNSRIVEAFETADVAEETLAAKLRALA